MKHTFDSTLYKQSEDTVFHTAGSLPFCFTLSRFHRREIASFFNRKKDSGNTTGEVTVVSPGSRPQVPPMPMMQAPTTPISPQPQSATPSRPRYQTGMSEELVSSTGASSVPSKIGLRYAEAPCAKEFSLPKIVLGRKGHFFVNDANQTVSRAHAEIIWNKTKKKWLLLDTSTNGTFLNGERLNMGSAVALKNGDHLRLANSKDIIIELSEEAVQEKDSRFSHLKELSLIGQTIAGWRIISENGRGGFSRVYVAVNNKNQMIAIKHIFDKHSTRESLQAFINQINSPNPPVEAHHTTQKMISSQNEYALVSTFNYPNIMHVFGKYSVEDHILILMEMINGPTLQQMIYDRGALDAENVVKVGIQIAQILHYLHTLPRPVIYKDMKPINLVVSRDGMVHLLDFGISQYYDPTKPDPNNFGSKGYAAPEQESCYSTPLSDIYSFGVTLFCALTGFSGNQVATLTPPLHPKHHVNVPEELDTLIAQMTNPAPSGRPGKVLDVYYKLHQIQELLKDHRP